jgi:hypothetical protein
MSLIEKLWKAHHDFLAGGPAIAASLWDQWLDYLVATK